MARAENNAMVLWKSAPICEGTEAKEWKLASEKKNEQVAVFFSFPLPPSSHCPV